MILCSHSRRSSNVHYRQRERDRLQEFRIYAIDISSSHPSFHLITTIKIIDVFSVDLLGDLLVIVSGCLENRDETLVHVRNIGEPMQGITMVIPGLNPRMHIVSPASESPVLADC